MVLMLPFFNGEAPTVSEHERRLRDAPFGAPERLSWLWHVFRPPDAMQNHEAADMPAEIRRGRDGEWSAFPPTLVCVGRWNMHQDKQRAYADALRATVVVDTHVAEFLRPSTCSRSTRSRF